VNRGTSPLPSRLLYVTCKSSTSRVSRCDVILHAPKNGFFYVIDRHSGALLSAEKFAPVNWASGIDKVTGRPIENRECTFQKRAFFWRRQVPRVHTIGQSMAYSTVTGLVYIPAAIDTILVSR